MKRFIALLLAGLTMLGTLSGVSYAADLRNFSKIRTYDDQFSDVPASSWFISYVIEAYEFGLMDGRSGISFDPYGHITTAEAVKLAADLNSLYYTGSKVTAQSTPWYRAYADYALAHQILVEDYPDYSVYITRAEFVKLFSATLPADAYTPISNLPDDSIPDISGENYIPEAYQLYRAGVITGSDRSGAFHPENPITRAEVAVILTRIVRPELRQTVTLESIQNSNSQIAGIPDTVNLIITSSATYNISYSEHLMTEFNLSSAVSDSSVAVCTPGEQNRQFHYVPLTINALACGTATLRLELFSTDGTQLLATKAVRLVVIASPAETVYYSGYYPVPDFGAFFGIQQAPGTALVSDGISVYRYKADSLASGPEAAISEYAALLGQNGFSSTGKSGDSMSFVSKQYGWVVKIQQSSLAYGGSSTSYVSILIIYMS